MFIFEVIQFKDALEYFEKHLKSETWFVALDEESEAAATKHIICCHFDW